MAKDAKGHGSDSKGGDIRQSFMNIYRNASRVGARVEDGAKTFLWNAVGGRDVGDDTAATALASGPKSDAVPLHDSMTSNSTHNDQGHAWGSPEALKDFSDRYNKGRASGFAKNRSEGKAFRSGAREISRLRKQGK